MLGAAVSFLVLFWLITQILRQPFLPPTIRENAALFVEGAQVTLYLTLISGVIGLVLGVLLGLGKMANSPLLASSASLPGRLLRGAVALVCNFLIWIVRGTPLYVQLLFAYYALPEILPPYKALLTWADTLNLIPSIPVMSVFVAAIVALSMNVAAYNAEVIRGGIQGVPRGQGEAARSLGLSTFQAMSTVILPQALRLSLPALVNNIVALLKDSSLAAVIGVTELAKIADQVRSSTFQPIPALAVAACVYLALTTVLTLFTDQLEKRVKIASR
ncbi:amino acid ABC transporter permease [Deinococcus arcticus]|uniref:Amino acid ABC transporter permease n=1 Tax=Deinococcus arcticus TaxID=2136176 RepID=A0A2T3WD83_9DEIO|nr:amino acid ABC transporter permease [Deinococcus arcticus]